jgi:hypothetical protein
MNIFNKYKNQHFRHFLMGKQSRIIAQKAKTKQQQTYKKPKAVKTNLKRVRKRKISKLFIKFYLVK